ncbi:hypothetical protein ACA910_001961 [Epithemia clementina (nom. ined.)]
MGSTPSKSCVSSKEQPSPQHQTFASAQCVEDLLVEDVSPEGSSPVQDFEQDNPVPPFVRNIYKETDYYRILGVAQRASIDDLKRSYRRLMQYVHPDKRTGNAELAAKVNEAYEVLSDPDLRSKYDQDKNLFGRHINFAKQSAAAIYREVKCTISREKVNFGDLLEGDHVYFFIPKKFGIAHHGIVTRVGESIADTLVIDFGAADAENVDNQSEHAMKIIREVSLDRFLPQNVNLYCAGYGLSEFKSSWKLVGAYHDKSLPPQAVLANARRLLMLGQMDYDLMVQSCETVAFWCKTEKLYSGQAEKFQKVLLSIAHLVVLRIGAWVLASAAAETVVGTLIVVHSLFWPLVVVSGVCLAAYGAIWLWKRRAARRLRNARSLEAINMITKLQSRDRSCVGGLVDPFLHNNNKELACSSLAHKLDEFVTPTSESRDKRVKLIELPKNVSFEFQMHFRRYTGDGNSPTKRSAKADEMLEFAVQVLLRCDQFNAILDLPDPQLLGGKGQTCDVLETLREAEFRIVDKRALVVEIVDYKLVDEDAGRKDSKKPAIFEFSVHVVDASGAAVTLRSRKAAKDFERLHQVLVDIHPKVQNLNLPSNSQCEEGKSAGEYAKYLGRLIWLCEIPDINGKSARSSSENMGGTDATLLQKYLTLYQATEVREQVVAFLTNPSAVALNN